MVELRGLKFMEEKDIKIRTGIACLTRVGSNLLKNIIEDVTGYFCGDDIKKVFPSVKWLVEHGQIKEKVDEVFVIKTHYPTTCSSLLRMDQNFFIHKAIIQVRNPINIIPSLFDMMYHKNHLTVSDKEVFIKNKELFDLTIESVAEHCEEHQEFWLKQPIPKYIVTYEKLLLNPEETLVGVLSFIQGEDITNTPMHFKLKERLKEGLTTTYLKKPRTTGSKSEFFSKEQIEKIIKLMPNYIKIYGYADEIENLLGMQPHDPLNDELKIDQASWNEKALKESYGLQQKVENATAIEIPGGKHDIHLDGKYLLLFKKMLHANNPETRNTDQNQQLQKL